MENEEKICITIEREVTVPDPPTSLSVEGSKARMDIADIPTVTLEGVAKEWGRRLLEAAEIRAKSRVAE